MTEEEVLAVIKAYEAEKAATVPEDWIQMALTWAEKEGILTEAEFADMRSGALCTQGMALMLLYRLWRRLKMHSM